MHRDIKMGNLLIQSALGHGHTLCNIGIVLCDFGLAVQLPSAQHYAEGSAGTADFMAPEVVVHEKAYLESDMFSVGSTLFHCCTGRAPFEADNAKEIYSRIKRHDYRWRSEEQKKLPAKTISMVDSMLRYEPRDRSTMSARAPAS